jgi:hypothetical protein
MPNCAARNYALLAHSAGGYCVQELFENKKLKALLFSKLKALVFTDAYYHGMFKQMTEAEMRTMKKIGVHFKAYSKVHKEVGEVFKE